MKEAVQPTLLIRMEVENQLNLLMMDLSLINMISMLRMVR